jgi:hypothetical protein
MKLFLFNLSRTEFTPTRPRDGPDVTNFIFAQPICIKSNQSFDSTSLLVQRFIESSRHIGNQNESFSQVTGDLHPSLLSMKPFPISAKNGQLVTISIESALMRALQLATEEFTSSQLSNHIYVIPPPPISPLLGFVRLWSKTETRNRTLSNVFYGGPTDCERLSSLHFIANVRNGFLGVAPPVISTYIVSLGITMSNQLSVKFEATESLKETREVSLPSAREMDTIAMPSGFPTTKRENKTTRYQRLLPVLQPSTRTTSEHLLPAASMSGLFTWSNAPQLPFIAPISFSLPLQINNNHYSSSLIDMKGYDTPCVTLVDETRILVQKDLLLAHIQLPSHRLEKAQPIGRLRSQQFSLPHSDIDRITFLNSVHHFRGIKRIECTPAVRSTGEYVSFVKKRLRNGYESLVLRARILNDKKCSLKRQERVSAGFISQMMTFPAKEGDTAFILPMSVPDYNIVEAENADESYDHLDDHLVDRSNEEQNNAHKQQQHAYNHWCWEQPQEEVFTGIEGTTEIDRGLIPPLKSMPSQQKMPSSHSLAFEELDFKLSTKNYHQARDVQ